MSLNEMSRSQKAEFMDLLTHEVATANVQDLLTKMTKKCFITCVNKPGSVLDSSEQKCIAMCVDRFLDSWSTVRRTYCKHSEFGTDIHPHLQMA